PVSRPHSLVPGGRDAADGEGPEPLHAEDRARPTSGEALHRRARDAADPDQREPRRGGGAVPPARVDRAAPQLRRGVGRGQEGEGRPLAACGRYSTAAPSNTRIVGPIATSRVRAAHGSVQPPFGSLAPLHPRRAGPHQAKLLTLHILDNPSLGHGACSYRPSEATGLGRTHRLEDPMRFKWVSLVVVALLGATGWALSGCGTSPLAPANLPLSGTASALVPSPPILTVSPEGGVGYTLIPSGDAHLGSGTIG